MLRASPRAYPAGLRYGGWDAFPLKVGGGPPRPPDTSGMSPVATSRPDDDYGSLAYFRQAASMATAFAAWGWSRMR
ncbi:hypothetical protein OJF2_65520 [Aquisphaera giovannonii]|uniref:Uncharacterized protein n=1 Tax=Aquisphaera giovannonii TaxID=406548 RepID=A0A5B9WBH6_9BACT|nr:hypothetical protein OJF2_65520 [Aquisphaera giovannonii]